MTGAAHLLVGSFMYGLTRGNRILGPALAFVSHFALDAIPHFDHFSWNIPLGFIAVLFLLRIAKRTRDPFFLISALFGMLPDINCLLKISNELVILHQYCHFNKTYPIPISYLYIEIYGCLVISYLISTRYSKRITRIRSNENPILTLFQKIAIIFHNLAPVRPHRKP
jgi:lipid-A-disaccharide synthase-like uncharacterized protein